MSKTKQGNKPWIAQHKSFHKVNADVSRSILPQVAESWSARKFQSIAQSVVISSICVIYRVGSEAAYRASERNWSLRRNISGAMNEAGIHRAICVYSGAVEWYRISLDLLAKKKKLVWKAKVFSIVKGLSIMLSISFLILKMDFKVFLICALVRSWFIDLLNVKSTIKVILQLALQS